MRGNSGLACLSFGYDFNRKAEVLTNASRIMESITSGIVTGEEPATTCTGIINLHASQTPKALGTIPNGGLDISG